MLKYMPPAICFAVLLTMTLVSANATSQQHVNLYPNLPAPIGGEKILITSAGQAAEGSILYTIADNLHVDADFRPRALDSDLYDYNSVVIVLGYSANGLEQTNRTYQAEQSRITKLAGEATQNQIPVILVNLSGAYRHDKPTWALFNQIIPNTDYYIGLKTMKNMDQYLDILASHNVPVTLVNDFSDIRTPFNSVFR
ncbi:DUF6305 family protein [Lentibacillus salinarum]|uniref:DUF6305 family protein n=1 Tax=Lentibacillus salinarum TaxID=446820 RepID=A0ABW3ZQV1_9BACI